MTRVIGLADAIASGEPYVYIGRAGRGEDGYFGNPHPVGMLCSLCYVYHSRGSSIAAFRVYLYDRVKRDQVFRDRVIALRGKTLACPGNCRPDRECHGDVYVEFLGQLTVVSACIKH